MQSNDDKEATISQESTRPIYETDDTKFRSLRNLHFLIKVIVIILYFHLSIFWWYKFFHEERAIFLQIFYSPNFLVQQWYLNQVKILSIQVVILPYIFLLHFHPRHMP